MLTLLAALALLVAPVQPERVQPESLDQGFVIVVDDIARVASPDRPMYLASNFGGWDPANKDFLLTQRSDGRWQIVFDKPDRTGTIQFKFTLGSWDYVETDPDGNDIENRTLPKVDPSKHAAGERPVIELSIPRFRSPSDIASGRQTTEYRDWEVTGTLRRLQVTGGAGDAAGTMRDLLIWLPPGYDEPENADRRYPVLYLFDGQNLFEKTGSLPGEWHADEIAQRLVTGGLTEPFVIVGVPNAGAARIQEYMPYESRLAVEPAGEAFGVWFMGTVVPRAERALRLTDDPAKTGIGGSSLGATIALAIGSHHPERFGLLLLESTANFGPDPDALELPASGWPTKAFVGVGGRETGEAADRNEAFAQWSRQLADRLEANAGPGRVRFEMNPDAKHTEAAWSSRLPDAFRFLFGTEGQ